MNRILKAVLQPRYAFDSIMLKSGLLSDKQYIDILYKRIFRHRINWEDPKTFNEKLNWLKIHDHNPLYSQLADKYAVKDYVSKKIGADYVVKNYGVWDTPESINVNNLPKQFVFKTTHDSGGVIICKDKEVFDFKAAKQKLLMELRSSHYQNNKEWVYKNICPRIIADQLLEDGTGHELTDYKFWCFNGVPKIMYITNKGSKIYENFYDMDFRPVDLNHGFERKKPEYECPQNFELMKELASILSCDIPFVRVDFFDINNKVYFGEFTFYDWGGMQPFCKYETDLQIGSWLNLPHL